MTSPSSPAATTREAVAARVAEVMAAAIDGARTIHGAAHVALSGGSVVARLRAGRAELPDWRDVHLWYGDERCVPLDDPESNHRLATEHARRARRDLAPGADAPRLRRGGRRLRARRSPTSRSTSRSTAWGPTGTPPRSSPASRRSTPRACASRVHGSPKPPPDRVTLTLAKLNASHRILLVVTGAGEGADARARDRRARIPRCPPRCWTASAWRSSPTPRPSMADEVWLAPPRRDRVVADGQAHRAHRHPAHRHGPRGGARRCARAWTARPSPSCSARRSRAPARRRSSRASSARGCATTSSSGTTASTRASPRRRSASSARTGTCGATARPAARAPTTSPPAATASSPRLRAADGDVALVAHGHILRALAARWVDAPVALGGRLHLGTGSISVLAYEREVAVHQPLERLGSGR